MNCGLIGHPLKHSYSCQIHRALASYDYRLWDLTPEELAPFLELLEGGPGGELHQNLIDYFYYCQLHAIRSQAGS